MPPSRLVLPLGACLATLAAGATACGAISAPPTSIEGPTPIYTADATGAALPVPFVEAVVGDGSELLALDTGASAPFLLGATAWLHDIESSEMSETSRGLGGRGAARRARPGVVRLGRYVAADVAVVESASLARHGIRGAISPQLLADADGAVVIDLLGGTLEGRARDSLRGWERGADLRTCRRGEDPREGWWFIATVAVAGIETPMLLDTAWQTTSLFDGAPAAEAIERLSRAAEAPSSGPASDAPRVDGLVGSSGVVVLPDVEVALGGAPLRLDLTRVAPLDLAPTCSALGVIGFDALRHCVLVLGTDHGTLRCEARAPSMRRLPVLATADLPVRLLDLTVHAACGLDTPDELLRLHRPSLPMEFASGFEAYSSLQPSLDEIVERAERVCSEHGYFDARVVRPLLRREGDDLQVVVEVDAGQRWRVRRVSVVLEASDGARRTLDAGTLGALRSGSGAPYATADVQADLDALGERLGALGVRADGFREHREIVGEREIDLELTLFLPAGSSLPETLSPGT